MRCLVVDDNEDGADTLATLLEMLCGAATSVAYDGVGALEAAARYPPDVVFLDYRLPVMNGDQVVRRLREMYGDDIVVVLVSGFSRPDLERFGALTECDHYIRKPYSPNELLAAMPIAA
jgi:CheY-like chemotaxis protein